MNKNSNIIIRVNDDTKENFKKTLEEKGYKVSEVLNAFMDNVITNNEIPDDIKKRISAKHLFSFDMSIMDIKRIVCSSINMSELNKKINKAYLLIDNGYKIIIITKDNFNIFDQNDLYSTLVDKLESNIQIEFVDRYNSINDDEICIYEGK